MLTRTEIRTRFKRLRDSFAAASKMGEIEERFTAQLCSVIGAGEIWAGYRAYGSEADPAKAIHKFKSKKWAFPRVEGQELQFYIPQPETNWVKGSLGVMEPDPDNSKKINLDRVSGVLVPGVAFDQWGGRLGSGKGFYDRALAGFSGLKVGVAYSVQLSEDRLPLEPHDVTMDMVVTESRVIDVKKSQLRKGLDHE